MERLEYITNWMHAFNRIELYWRDPFYSVIKFKRQEEFIFFAGISSDQQRSFFQRMAAPGHFFIDYHDDGFYIFPLSFN